MKCFWYVVFRIMNRGERLYTLVLAALTLILLFGGVGLLYLGLSAETSYLPQRLRNLNVAFATIIPLVLFSGWAYWRQKFYLPAREIYFYDHESWDEGA